MRIVGGIPIGLSLAPHAGAAQHEHGGHAGAPERQASVDAPVPAEAQGMQMAIAPLGLPVFAGFSVSLSTRAGQMPMGSTRA